MELDGRPLGRIESAEAREIPPRSVELYRFSLPAPARPARDESASRRWRLLGTITVEGRRFPLEAEGRLDPVPGRPRLYR
ncbi:MAG: hypothetical protein RML12_03570 [Xanthomonadales bacterium]|nr:hypothetical protein [Xanthomonadales bacterium]